MERYKVNTLDSNKKILITGGAGFIGFHVIKHILTNRPDITLISVDNLNNYYDLNLKQDRLKVLEDINSKNYTFIEMDITDRAAVDGLFENNSFDAVINLAAQAGVRYARENPESYIQSNIDGFYNIAEHAAKYHAGVLVYASSSSVYGANDNIPFKESDRCASPMSLYAATKLSNENIAAAYYHTHNLPSVGLRFFNVYGPWGRPDMAYYKWSKNIIQGEVIELRDKGEMYRDMTYVDDVVAVIDALIARHEELNFEHEILNVGNESPVKIIDMLEYIQSSFDGYATTINNVSKGSEEPYRTFADTGRLRSILGFAPSTSYEDGLKYFVDWFKDYYSVK